MRPSILINDEMKYAVMAMYWRRLNELDIFFTNQRVETLCGADVGAMLPMLQQSGVPIEVFD